MAKATKSAATAATTSKTKTATAANNITTKSAGELVQTETPANVIADGETPTVDDNTTKREEVQAVPESTADVPEITQDAAGDESPAAEGDPLETKAPEVPFMTEEIDPDIEEMMQAYKKCYPREKRFCVTSDKQVFLERSKSDAYAHQKKFGVHDPLVYETEKI